MSAFGFIYITTNLVNGKKYIGQSSYSSNKKNYYLGSGKYLITAIKKYGKENFKRETICNAFTREDLSILETYFISEYNAVEDPMFYNIAAGGYATRGFAGKKHTPEFKAKQAEYGRNRPVTENMKKAFEQNRQCGFSGTEKHRAALVKNGKANKGRKKYNNGIQNFSLFPDDPKIEELNLIPGLIKNPTRGQKNIGKKWFNNGIDTFLLFPNDPKIDKLNLVIGNIKQDTSGRICFNDGIRNFFLFPNDPKIKDLIKGPKPFTRIS